jgi:hypothetical protein
MANDAARMNSPSDKRHPGDFPDRLQGAPASSVASPFREVHGLPFLSIPHVPMELFDPDQHASLPAAGHSDLSRAAEPLPLAIAARLHPDRLLIPRREDCDALWERYAMLDNIRVHSEQVAGMGYALALLAKDLGLDIYPEALLAAGLLHDLAKTHTIYYGGNHAQLGAAWVMRETGNGAISQAVLAHVFWPWMEDADNDDFFMPMAIAYADKRIMHDRCVPLEERFEDLLVRYGINDHVRSRIKNSFLQGKRMEEALSRRLGVSLHEYTVDSGRLVKRA